MYRPIYVILLTLLLALMAFKSRAENSIELVGPGLTYHIIDNGASNLYSNKISSDGRLILTPQLGLKYTYTTLEGVYNSLALFTAENSIGSPIYGGIMGIGLQFSKYFNLGAVAGGYVQNNEDFSYKGIVPFSLTGGENAFVPIIGIEANFKYYLTPRVFLGENNIITPIIANSNLSIGYKF